MHVANRPCAAAVCHFFARQVGVAQQPQHIAFHPFHPDFRECHACEHTTHGAEVELRDTLFAAMLPCVAVTLAEVVEIIIERSDTGGMGIPFDGDVIDVALFIELALLAERRKIKVTEAVLRFGLAGFTVSGQFNRF